MTDPVLERITFQPVGASISPIPFPEGLAPVVVKMDRSPSSPLPHADIIVSTFTAAEGQALADVLSPGLKLTEWTKYAHNFSEFEPDLTWRSPAKESRCLGQYAVVKIGDKTVLLFRNELHLATDSEALPLRKVWGQMIRQATPDLWIDTGTAGGIGPDVVEGDTVAAPNLIFDCTGMFKSETWAHLAYPCTYDTSSIDFSEAERLMEANASQLRPEATRDPKVWHADVVTCDSFLFDMVGDPFGLETYDNAGALVEEMDASVLGLVAEDVGDQMPKFTSLRSVSDPQMPKGSVEDEKRAASKIYEHFGYAAQVATLCAVWQVITTFNPKGTRQVPDLKLGKLAATRPEGLLDLFEYQTEATPAPPVSVEYAAHLTYGMDGNDQYGDCVMAGTAHLIQAWDSEVTEQDPVPTDAAIVKEYFVLTGGQDSGLNEASVLGVWHKSGLFGKKIEGYAPVDFKDLTALKQCIAFYGGCMFGIQCPESAQQQFGAGEPWTVVPGSPIEGGHCIVAIGYDAEFVHCVTWGAVVKVAYAFLKKYLDEAWGIVPSQFVEAGKGPTLNLAALKADLASLDH